MSIYKRINDNFLELQNKLTNRVSVAFLVWLILAAFANLFVYLEIGGEITPAILQLIGIVLFLESLWRLFKRRKDKSATSTQTKIIKNSSSNKQPKARLLLSLGIGIFVILIIFVGIYSYTYNRPSNSKAPVQQYDNKIEEQNYEVQPNTPDSVTTRKEQQLDECLAATAKWYDDMIDNYCKDYEIKENCNLPEDTVYKWIDIQREYRNECLVRYK